MKLPRSGLLLRTLGLPLALLAAACSASGEGAISGTPDAPPAAGLDAPLAMPADAAVAVDARRADSRVSPALDGGGDFIFDPCRPDPRSGYDPVGAGLATCCATGPSHCVPREQILPLLADNLAECDDGAGACMPDNIIQAGGSYRPAACTSSVIAGPGACLSTCIPLVADNPFAGLLKQDGCATGEKCIPCTNPLDGQPTGACNLIETLCPVVDAPDAGVADAGPDAAVACPHTGPPILDPATLPSCSPACGGAHCVPATLVPAAQQPLLSSCTATGGAAGLCAPDDLIRTGGNFVPPTCTSVAGAEGRCMSTCLPDIAEKGDLLPDDDCPAGMKCAPCFDPTAPGNGWMEPTGVCSLACDEPDEPPVQLTCPWTGPDVLDPATLPACSPACAGAHCVPAALVPEGQRDLLAPCPGGFCTPDEIIRSGNNWVPPTCESIAGAEGRCLSTCLPSVSGEPLLPGGGCGANRKCVPCFNPIAADPAEPTGACDLGCDAPTDPPVILMCPWEGPPVIDPGLLPACGSCGEAHCLPARYVPTDQRDLLAPCTGGFCTPDPIIETAGNFKAPSCIAFAGTPAEGRCLSTCLPIVAGQPTLERSTCPPSERCAPCGDPFTGEPTGACEVACDQPVTTPPFVFPGCCFDQFDNNRGTCVPRSQVPDADEERLEQDQCPSNDYGCVPNEMLPGGPGPSSCTFGFPPLGYNGTCYSRCLDLGALEGAIPRGDCPPDYACVP